MNNPLFTNKRSFEFVSNPGQAEQEVFHGELMPDNSIRLVSDGFENIQNFIDSFRESTEIENIIRRVNNGEIDLLNAKQGVFGDFVGMPNSRSEALNSIISAQRFFESLPKEITDKFNGSFDEWFNSVGNEDFLEKSGLIRKVVEGTVPSESEVVTNES